MVQQEGTTFEHAAVRSGLLRGPRYLEAARLATGRLFRWRASSFSLLFVVVACFLCGMLCFSFFLPLFLPLSLSLFLHFSFSSFSFHLAIHIALLPASAALVLSCLTILPTSCLFSSS